ncbi:BRO-N domain-containing protein [Dyella koreensis]|uniref:Bro-N domain-containing protein n=1 Tax=Dyella koreensis TaxID=311235 RepID=A0ABW8K5H0_9GAMM
MTPEEFESSVGRRVMRASFHTFHYKQYEIRSVTQEGSSWFAATDVHAAVAPRTGTTLEMDLGDIPDSLKAQHCFQGLGGSEWVCALTENGVHFLLGLYYGHSASVRVFHRWFVQDVAPVIRRLGLQGLLARAHLARALACHAGEQVSSDLFRAVLADEAPLQSAGYLVNLGHDGLPMTTFVPDGARLIEPGRLLDALKTGFIDRRLLKELVAAGKRVLVRRNDWPKRHPGSDVAPGATPD